MENEEVTTLDELKELANGTEHDDSDSDAETEKSLDEIADSDADKEKDVDTDVDDNDDTDSEDESDAEYKPSFVYKVRDEEKTFDERLQGIIKTKDDEDYIRDLVTKADGLDNYKQKFSTKEEELADAFQKVNTLANGFQTIKQYRDSKDFHKLAETVGWEKEDIIKFALTLAEEQQLPEEERNKIEAERKVREENALLKSQIEQRDQVQSAESAEAETNELRVELSKPENYEIAEALHAEGVNMAEEVVAVGRYIYKTTNKYPSVSEVVAQVANKYRPFINKAKEVVDTTTDELVNKHANKPTLKRPSSSAKTGVSEGISSLDQLRKMADAIDTK